MATTNKMQWFIDKYNNNELTYDIAATGRNYGTICMPTGTGKSAKIYANTIYNINRLAKDGWQKKLVVNMNSNILKLNNQLVNDFLEIITGTDILNSNEIAIYINSSDKSDSYKKASVNNIQVANFNKTSEFSYKLNLVISCNPSLYHFYKKIPKMDRENLEVITYLDESHTLAIYGDDDIQASTGKNKEAEKPNIKKLCQGCDKVYAFSATPDPDITRTINSFETSIEDGKYIILINPSEAIAANQIVSPRFRYVSYDKGADMITADLCENCLVDAKSLTPEIKHKVLVTCSDSDHLYDLRTALEKDGYKVFSTCSKFLYDLDETNNIEEAKNMSIEKFTQEIEDYNGDCFVLHIRQLICGIDVKALTDAIIYDNFTGATSSWRIYVQTIGRILRCANGERGLGISKRTKKYGNVYFYNPEKDENQLLNIAHFFTSVYGVTTAFETVFMGKNGTTTRTSMTELKNKGDGKNHDKKNNKVENIYIEDVKIKIQDIINNYKKNNHIFELISRNKATFEQQVYLNLLNVAGNMTELNTVDVTNTQESIRDIVHEYGKSVALW